jgi:hypothetical protein
VPLVLAEPSEHVDVRRARFCQRSPPRSTGACSLPMGRSSHLSVRGRRGLLVDVARHWHGRPIIYLDVQL